MLAKRFLLVPLPLLLAAVAASPSAATTHHLVPTPVVIGVDLPMQGVDRDFSADTLAAIQLVVDQAGGMAGAYAVTVRPYDDSKSGGQGGWDAATCVQNAHSHVANVGEVAVIGTYNSGCAELEVPILDQDPSGPMAMISHTNSYPGLLRVWGPGEPDK
jgi:branched-chain amino acid transport system substrate-binding protein